MNDNESFGLTFFVFAVAFALFGLFYMGVIG